jgi:hypothetical protein
VIFNGVLATTSHNDYVVDASRDCFLDDILNDWFVNQRQHFFRLSLGCR